MTSRTSEESSKSVRSSLSGYSVRGIDHESTSPEAVTSSFVSRVRSHASNQIFLANDLNPVTVSRVNTLYDDSTCGEKPVSVASTAGTSAIPDGGYGWVCVGCATALNFCAWGSNCAYAVYLSYFLNHHVYPGATEIDFAVIGGMIIGISCIVAPLVTYLVGVLGIRITLSIGVVLQVGGYIASSFAKRIWQLYLSHGLTVGLGIGCCFIPGTMIIPQWFSRRRAVANGIAAAGTGLGGLAFSWINQGVIQALSVHWAYRVTAVVNGAISLVAILLIRSRNDVVKPEVRLWDLSLLRSYPLMMLYLLNLFSQSGFVILLYSLGAYATLALGATSHQGAVAISVLNAAQTVARPLIGIFADRCGRVNATLLLNCLIGIFCLALWTQVDNYAGLIGFAIVAGLFMGGI